MHRHPLPLIAVIVATSALAGGAFAFATHGKPEPAAVAAPVASTASPLRAEPTEKPAASVNEPPKGEVAGAHDDGAQLSWPIADAARRVTKKPFGLYVTPETSPVPNDRFTGYHVGVDFETFPEEQDVDVPIYAACDGPLRLKTYAKGYGGMALQECTLDGRPVTVIYGHLFLESITAEAGTVLTRGEQIGVLGRGYSEQTDGVRKHLHFGIHAGTETDIHGYVKDESETAAFLDARKYLPQ